MTLRPLYEAKLQGPPQSRRVAFNYRDEAGRW